jgi:PleD family two-component response regulator
MSRNGHISLFSAPGKGSIFKILFPVVEEKPLENKKREQREPAPGNETILLADDDDMVRDFLKQTLEMLGYTVLAAKTGSMHWNFLTTSMVNSICFSPMWSCRK